MKLIRREPDKAYLDTWLWVPKQFVNVYSMQSALSFTFVDKYTNGQRVLQLWKETEHHLLVPRAFWDPATLPYPTVDCRPRSYKNVEFKSRIKLDHQLGVVDGKEVLVPTGDDVQRRSLRSLQDAMGGTLQLACGKGKTVVALENVHVEKVPALIVVDNSQLLEQWDREVQKMLEVPGGVGCLDGKHDDWKGRGIVLATYQTLSSRAGDLPEEFRRYFGGVYFDEGHHVSAPVFSRCVDLIYGKRYSLTATPERDDGWHIISDYHVGKVLYRDLRQPMKPLIIFKATHFELNIADPLVAKAVLVKNEVHISKLMSYFGSWRDRLLMVMQDAYEAVQAGRKVLVLSNSVDEVVNLMTMWTRGLQSQLYSDIPVPTAADVGETTSPIFISATDMKKLERSIARLSKSSLVDPAKLQELELQLAQAKVGNKIQLVLAKKQATFLKDLIKEPSTAGVMTYGVPPKLRQRFLDERSVVFAITKYGREGMDCPTLDTVIVSTPFSSKNNMQQLMGRPTRYKLGKRMPVIIIYEDSIGQCYGMCQKLRKHLRSWPHEEGGPFEYEMIGNPRNVPCKIQTLSQAFGL